MDVSGNESIIDRYNTSPYNKHVKLVTTNTSKPFGNFIHTKQFSHVANVLIDDDVKRQTVIRFEPLDNNIFNENAEYIYIFTINDNIVKIGGTRNGLKDRANSYLCGHSIKERGKKGKCSITNAYIYNTFDFYLQQGCEIKMYGYRLPKVDIDAEIFGQITKINAQTYHAYESILIQTYCDQFGHTPALNDNSDPEYRKNKKGTKTK